MRYWFLLPAGAVHPSVVIPLCLAGNTFRLATEKLQFYEANLTTEKSYRVLTPELMEEFRAGYFKNQRLRWAAKRLVSRWLLRKKFQAAAEDDLVTCEPPRQRVTLYDWSARRTYPFEARTIYRDAIERLLHHEELWAVSHAPRNPYTNLPLTLAQAWHIVQQTRSFGFAHWALDGFAAASYNLRNFVRIFGQPLKLSALNRLFRDISSQDFEYVFMDFVEDEHAHFGRVCNKAVYRWALKNVPAHERIVKWRKACYRYHELSITIADLTEQKAQQDLEITAITRDLCEPVTELLTLRSAAFKEALLSQSQDVSAALPIRD